MQFVRAFIAQRNNQKTQIIVWKFKHRQRSLTKQIFYKQLRKSYRKCLKSQLNSTIYRTLTEKTWLEQAVQHRHRRRYKSCRPSLKRFHTYHLDHRWNWHSEIWRTESKKDVLTVSSCIELFILYSSVSQMGLLGALGLRERYLAFFLKIR